MFQRPILALAVALGLACTACAREPGDFVLRGRVLAIVDGDTIDVALDSGTERVRLYGIDAPEAEAPFGREATLALRKRVAGRVVELGPVADDSRDAYDRLLAVVYVDGISVNEVLVTDGHAWAFRRYLGQMPGDDRNCDLEAAARAARRGLWSLPPERWVPPWIYRERQRSLPGARVPSRDYRNETAAGCRAAIGRAAGGAAPAAPVDEPAPAAPAVPAPGDCTIKGNISRHGAKNYHLPGSEHYADTRIDTARGERWFCSEAEAQAAGWRRAR